MPEEKITGAKLVHDGVSAGHVVFELENGGIATVHASYEKPAESSEGLALVDQSDDLGGTPDGGAGAQEGEAEGSNAGA